MNELPPDPPRLRAILAHLDKQIADTETVATYLRLQRHAVLTAISRAELKAIPRPVISAPKRPPAAPRRESSSRPSRVQQPPVDPLRRRTSHGRLKDRTDPHRQLPQRLHLQSAH